MIMFQSIYRIFPRYPAGASLSRYLTVRSISLNEKFTFNRVLTDHTISPLPSGNYGRHFTGLNKQSYRQFSSSTYLNRIRRGASIWRLSYNDTWKNYNKYYGRNPWNKLLRPALFTVGFCVLTSLTVPYLFTYTPLAYFKRNPRTLVYALIGLNGIVFLMWKSPYFGRWLGKYGLLMKEGHQSNWALLTSAFSHQSFMHLFVNMFVLSSFGSALCATVGASNFSVMYLNSAVISSFVSLLLPVIAGSFAAMPSLGASGAIFSVFGAFSYLFPKSAVAFFFIPVPGGAWVLFLGSMLWNVAGFALRWGKYDYAAHLGGCVAGLFYGWIYNEERKKRIRKIRHSYGF